MSTIRRRRRNDLILEATAGITSINGQTEAAQFLTPGNSIEIDSVGGVHTIGVATQSITIAQLAPLEIEDSVVANEGISVGKLNSGGAGNEGKIMIADNSQGFDLIDHIFTALTGSPNHQSSSVDTIFFDFSSNTPSTVNVDRGTIVPFDCEAKDLIVFIQGNLKLSDTIYTLSVNEGTTFMIISVPAGAAGNGINVQLTDVRRDLNKGDRLTLRQSQNVTDSNDITLATFGLVLIARTA